VSCGGGWRYARFALEAFAPTGGPAELLRSMAAFFLYLVAVMDTTATIPTGSMAARWKFKSFIWWGLFCGAIFYPLFGAWTWGGGWLSQLGNSLDLGFGYVDFAGSGIVHAMGGAAALAGALILGPRIGKFGKDGKARALPGHNIPMALLGAFILLFGWFGFNAASTFAATDVQFAVVATNTAIAAAFGSVVAGRRPGRVVAAPLPHGACFGVERRGDRVTVADRCLALIEERDVGPDAPVHRIVLVRRLRQPNIGGPAGRGRHPECSAGPAQSFRGRGLSSAALTPRTPPDRREASRYGDRPRWAGQSVPGSECPSDSAAVRA